MKRTWFISALTLLAFAAGSYGLYLYLLPEALPEQVVYGNGQIEGTAVRVAPELTGQVIEDHVVEGQTVAKGDVLFELDDAELQLEAQRARAEIKALRAQQQQTRGNIDATRHHLATASADLERYRQLLARGFATPRSVEEVENRFEEARANVRASQAQLAALEANIETVQTQLEMIKRRLAKTTIAAPTDGSVLVKGVEQGELAQAGQAAAVLADLSKIELRIFIPETDLAKIKLGDPARIKVDGFPEEFFEGRVARVDQQAQFTPRDVHMPEERVRTVFGILLSVENPEGQLKPGMPADAWILWSDDDAWPSRLFVPTE